MKLHHVFWVSTLYCVAFFAEDWLFSPLQERFLPGVTGIVSLLFLPHGVRVLATWMLGWGSAIAILPGVAITYLVQVPRDPEALQPYPLIIIVFLSVFVPATFTVLNWLGAPGLYAHRGAPCARCVLFGGLMASIVNAVFWTYILKAGEITFFGYIIGDFAGLFFLLIILIFLFKIDFDRILNWLGKFIPGRRD